MCSSFRRRCACWSVARWRCYSSARPACCSATCRTNKCHCRAHRPSKSPTCTRSEPYARPYRAPLSFHTLPASSSLVRPHTRPRPRPPTYLLLLLSLLLLLLLLLTTPPPSCLSHVHSQGDRASRDPTAVTRRSPRASAAAYRRCGCGRTRRYRAKHCPLAASGRSHREEDRKDQGRHSSRCRGCGTRCRTIASRDQCRHDRLRSTAGTQRSVRRQDCQQSLLTLSLSLCIDVCCSRRRCCLFCLFVSFLCIVPLYVCVYHATSLPPPTQPTTSKFYRVVLGCVRVPRRPLCICPLLTHIVVSFRLASRRDSCRLVRSISILSPCRSLVFFPARLCSVLYYLRTTESLARRVIVYNQ